jgi:eukaryotic-like serine/threonine-protein kinase
MTDSRTLQPADEIAQYRVVGPLGVGGMGEVYLAQDRKLERNVALKVLPPDVTRSEDRVRRFVQEAKSASSLNHPNIVTIYEIGHEPVKSASGPGDSLPVHFISMELISGKTLTAKIHEEKSELRTLLGYLAQAAEGVAKAHAAGIVHRDLKPGNIMISDDGFAKVLDFGLAKLTERSGSGAPSEATEAAQHTMDGAVMGTAYYMSPEQVQGKPVDARSDIFSFGCILYEVATRQRPFVAESSVETMHKILHDKPRPIEELNAEAPAELRRLVRRCMAKSPDQRAQSMKDIAIELREIVEEYDSLSSSATSASMIRSGPAPRLPARKPRLALLVGGAVLVGVAGIGFGLWSSKRGAKPAAEPFQSMRIVTQTNRGDIKACAISPDGRYLAYIGGKGNDLTLRVRQIATGSDVEVLPPRSLSIQSPCFSPDGNYLFYLKGKPETPNYHSLTSVPSLGGPEQERAFDVDSRVTFSPDAKQACFMRGVPQRNYSALFVIDLDTGKERELAAIRPPEQLAGAPSWAPDGKHIAAPLFSQNPELQSTLVLYDAESGKRQDFWTRKAAVLTEITWLPDGKGFVLAGTDVTLGIRQQLFLLTYPGAAYRRVTNDLNTYTQPSAASGQEAIAAVRSNALTNLYVVPAGGGELRALTSATNPEYSPVGFSAAEGLVFYSAIRGEYMTMFSLPLTGGEPVPMATGNGHVLNGFATGKEVIFNRYDTTEQRQHGWRMNQDGTGLRALTSGAGERVLDVSRDGRWATYTQTDSTRGVWLLSLETGTTRVLSSTGLNGMASISPDGRSVAVMEFAEDQKGLVRNVFKILSTEGGVVASGAQPPLQAVGYKWGPDGRSISFIDRADPTSNVYLAGAGGASPRQVTKFTEGRVANFEWSHDGSRLAVVRRIGDSVNAWVVMADGSQPKQLTNFTTDTVFEVDWTPDDKNIVLSAGRQSSDAVLVRNFR